VNIQVKSQSLNTKDYMSNRRKRQGESIGGNMTNIQHPLKKKVTISAEESISQIEEGLRTLIRVVVRATLQEIQVQSSVNTSGLDEQLQGSVTQSEKLVYSVPEVSKLLGLSRASVYEATRTKQIPSVIFGRRIFIPCIKLKQLLAQQ